MATINNKKGSTGFHVIAWNFSAHITCTDNHDEYQYMIRPVEVLSCGKIQMTARYTDEQRMAKHFFDPETKFYATREDAIEEAKARYEVAVAAAPAQSEKNLENTRAYLRMYNNKFWKEALVENLAKHERVLNNEFPFVALDYTSWSAVAYA